MLQSSYTLQTWKRDSYNFHHRRANAHPRWFMLPRFDRVVRSR